MIIGGKREELGGYIGREFNSKSELGEKVLLDFNNPHMVTVCGKRGSGKSHTLGVIAEELMTLPMQVKSNLSGFIIDAMGIYWSLQIKNSGSSLLEDWELNSKGYPVKVYYPAGLEEKYNEIKEYFHEGFELYPSELTISDWLYLLDIDETQAQAGLLAEIIESAEEEFGQYYSVQDLISELKTAGESENIKNALLRRLEKAESWGIFSSSGQKIEDIVQGGEFVVLDLSGAGVLPWNVRTMLTGILVRKIYGKRSFARSKEEVKKIKGEEEEGVDFPLIWLFLDEAHLFAPAGKKVPSSDPLAEWVRQGRRPGLSIVLATQQPGSLDNRILSQCDTLVIHRVTAGQDSEAVQSKISELYGAKEMRYYMKNIPTDPGYAYIMNDKFEDIVPIKIRPRKSWHAGGSAKLEVYLSNKE